jgi:hypothetical protein
MIGKTTLMVGAAVLWGGVAFAGDVCRYGGSNYSHGSTACQSGTQFRCDDGEWISMSIACPEKQAKSCSFDGSNFSSGSASCQAGTQYRCTDGEWRSLGVACSAGDAPRIVVPVPPAPRTCMLDGTTVASSSTVCKTGTTYLCDDGEWRNLGTPCK